MAPRLNARAFRVEAEATGTRPKWLMLAIGLAGRLRRRFEAWPSAVIAGGIFIIIVAIAQVSMPEVGEIPAEFSGNALWRFRAASLGMQMLIWATLGLVFSALAVRLLDQTGRGTDSAR